MIKRKYVEVSCAYCGKIKSIRSDSVKEKNYCNQSCSQKDRLKEPKNHPSWSGGRRIRQDGYIEIHMPNHHRARANGYVFEHIVVLEEKLGRKLSANEQCHHIDGNKQNNNPENLISLNIKEHSLETSRIRRQKNTFSCLQCGKEVYRKPYEQRKNRNIFCSRSCLGKWTHKNKKGVFNNDK